MSAPTNCWRRESIPGRRCHDQHGQLGIRTLLALCLGTPSAAASWR